jgi:hypothetical protein
MTGMLRTGLRFESILVNAEQALRLALDKARLESDHGLSIGEQAEASVRDMLRGLLPAGYGVGTGHIYDAYGDRSRQTDVVITNPEHPLSFPEGRSGTYLVDGVSAAGEVKATLNLKKLDDCLEKGAQFKELRMSINDGDHVLTPRHQELIKQIGLVPPFFVLAFDSKIAIDTLCQRLQTADLVSPPAGKTVGPEDDGYAPQPPIDAVCILGQGVALYIRPNNPMGVRIKEAPDRSGWLFMPTDAPLAWTLTWLHSAMPRVIRGGSVFAPYLIPNQRLVTYMASRGYIQLAQPDSEATAQEGNS